MRQLGFELSIDDFGTGYSSLSHLQRLPVNRLKIDISFVRDIITNPDSAAIACTTIALTRSLALRTIAEGVETVEQRDLLRSMGCDAYQGYLVSPAVPAREFEKLLEQPA